MSLFKFHSKAATRANNRKSRRLFSKMDSEMPFLALEIRQLLSGSDPNPPTTWTTQGSWTSGYQAEISVKNQQSTWIDDYQFQFDLADNITSFWGGKILSHTGSRYTVAPDSWSSRLNSGATAKFGFIASGTAGPVAAKVQNPLLSWNLDGGTGTGGGGGTIVAGQVSLDYKITNTWSGGFNGEVKVINTGTSSINGWELKFNTTNTLSNVWNGILSGSNTGTILIKNDTWNGTLAPGGSATIGFTASGSATALPTSFLFNGVAVTPSFNGSQPVVTPSISTNSLSIVEGQSGTKNLTYSVNLSAASASTITVQYATSDITASAGSDYIATSGTLTFAPGVTSLQIPVVINGDTDVEGDESFKLTFSNPIGATLGTTSVTGLITNDDTAPAPPLPSLVVSSPSITEGNSSTTDMVFTVTLSAAATSQVTVSYATSDGTATAGSDYSSASGTLTFAPGETTKSVAVKITGDTSIEPNETLKMLLSGAVGAVITTATGTGTILNDDSAAPPPASSGKQIVGYFAEWGIYGRNYNIADIPADKLTVVNYAFAQIKNGEVAVYDSYAATDKAFPGDTWDQPLKGNFNQIAKLKAANPNLKVVISVGGWTLSSPFSDAALTDASRKKFTDSAVRFVKQYGFDGIDLDWEYPVSGGLDTNVTRPADKHNYTLLVQSLKSAFNAQEAIDGRDYLVTIAVPPGYSTMQNFEVAELAKSLDWMNVMAYDYHGAWENTTGHNAPLYANPSSPFATESQFNVDYIMKAYVAAGVPKNQLVMGAPMYARTWKGVAPGPNGNGLFQSASGAGSGTWENGVIDYSDLLNKVKTDPATYKLYRDNASQVPYVYAPTKEGGWFSSFEDTTSLGTKLDYIMANDYGGMMFWELDADVRNASSPDSLLGLAASRLLSNQSGLPGMSISDLSVVEGNSGTKTATLTITLSKAASTPVTVNYGTFDGTAKAGEDYVSGSGAVSFAAGETSKSVNITINGDSTYEADENLQVRLTNASGATLIKSAGTVTVVNDDTAPPPPVSSGTAVLNVTGTWLPGFGGEITVKNTTGAAISNGWILEFDSNFDITSIWNAEIVSRVGTRYKVKSLSWNGSLAPNATVKFGMNGSMAGGATTPAISNATIRSV